MACRGPRPSAFRHKMVGTSNSCHNDSRGLRWNWCVLSSIRLLWLNIKVHWAPLGLLTRRKRCSRSETRRCGAVRTTRVANPRPRPVARGRDEGGVPGNTGMALRAESWVPRPIRRAHGGAVVYPLTYTLPGGSALAGLVDTVGLDRVGRVISASSQENGSIFGLLW